MGDAENQPSKKRAAGVQLSRENPGLDDDEETSELQAGSFKKASEEVLATRRIVKVRRSQTSSAPAEPVPTSASNPFAAIRLIPPASSSAPVVEAKDDVGKSEETEQKIDENKVDESKDESTAKEEKTANVDVDNAKQSESKVDDSKAHPDAEKEEKPAVDEGVVKATEGEDTKAEAEKEVEDKKNDEENGNGEKNAEAASFSSFQQLSSNQNAFSGITGTGFSSTSFSFGTIPKDGSSQGTTTNSLFGLKTENPTFSFGGVSNNGNSSIFGSAAANIISKSEGSKLTPMQEVPVETGEENEKAVLTADSVLFEFLDGSWKERGKGELKVNVPTTGTGKARLVMRARGNYRLILNASLFPDMKLTNMDKKGVTFACVNSAGEGKEGLCTFALKFKEVSIVEEFKAAVMEHKSDKAANKTTPVSLKTPENSPKASDE